MLQNGYFIPQRVPQFLWLHLPSVRILFFGCPCERGVLSVLVRCPCFVLQLIRVQKVLSLVGNTYYKIRVKQTERESKTSWEFIFLLLSLLQGKQKEIKITPYDGLCSMHKKHAAVTRFFSLIIFRILFLTRLSFMSFFYKKGK